MKVITNSVIGHIIYMRYHNKNLIILIPNEGHHGPQEDEDRFLDQPFIPQNAVLNKGTNIPIAMSIQEGYGLKDKFHLEPHQ
jgi:hypothetical protein